MPYNIPKRLLRYIEIGKHITQDRSIVRIPQWAQYILVVGKYCSHKTIYFLKNNAAVPVIQLQEGWSRMRDDLIRYGIVPKTEVGP